jgi:HK97 gp10 family phage protein
MIEIKVDVSGNAAKKLLEASFSMARNVDRAILSAAILVEATAKKKISRGALTKGEKSEKRLYGIGNKKFNRADQQVRSAPGEPPKTDTGRLVGSITHEHSFLTASVGSNVSYAGYLELGTKHMEARPYLQPSLDESQDEIEKMIMRAMQETMNK